MALALLDTDILSEVFKGKDLIVAKNATDFLTAHQQFAFSAISFYEVLRGLKTKQATRQLEQLHTFCQHALVLDVSTSILELAADLWTLADQQGRAKDDADLIIAATAISQNRVLITANTNHFSWIAGLSLDNWRHA